MLLGLGQWNWVCIHDVWKGLHGHQFGNVEPLYLHLPYQPNMAHSIYSICTSNTSSLTTDFIVYSYKKNTYQRKVLLEIFKRSSLMTYHIYIYLIIIYINLYIYIYILPLHTCTAWPTQTAGGIFACNVQAYTFFWGSWSGSWFLGKKALYVV